MRPADLIFLTSEDEKYLVKGGIGTAVGNLVNALAKYQGYRRVDWITESPSFETFIERQANVTRHYVSRYIGTDRLPLSCFSVVIGTYLTDLIESRRVTSPDSRLIIDAADWEGLAASYFYQHDYPNQLKVTRLHTPLIVCADLNRLAQSGETVQQMARERQQLTASNLLSSPTEYILQRTLDLVLQDASALPCSLVIPNCATASGPSADWADRKNSLIELRALTGLSLPDTAFHVFVLGSLEIRKGSEIIQKSIPLLFESIPNCHVTWIGHFSTSVELTANTKLDSNTFYAGIPNQWHHRVHLTGYIDHSKLPDVLKAADMYALCYLGDNFPGALLEIALAGVPMVVLLRGGIPEMIFDGARPLAYTLNDSASDSVEDQLAAAALEIYSNPTAAKELALDLKCHINENYNDHGVMDRLISNYERELKRKMSVYQTYSTSPEIVDDVCSSQIIDSGEKVSLIV